MKSLCWVRVLFSLLIVGVLGGGLMTPPSSEAASITIAGTTISNLPTCAVPSGYTACFAIFGGTHPVSQTFGTSGNQWTVGDYSGSNIARILINDLATNPNCTSNCADKMVFSGVTFTPVSPVEGTFRTLVVSVSHTFTVANQGGDGVDYYWSGTETGVWDPSGTADVGGNQLTLAISGSYPAAGGGDGPKSFSIPTIDTGSVVVTLPTDSGLNKFIKKSTGATFGVTNALFTTDCNTTNTTCTPTVTYTFTIKIKGNDTLKFDNSASGCGGPCDPNLQPGDRIGKLPPCYIFLPLCEEFSTNTLAQDEQSAKAEGATEAQTCLEACIVNVITATPDKESAGVSFDFTATGSGVQDFTLTASKFGQDAKAFSKVTGLLPDTDLGFGEWVFAIPDYPLSARGTWQADQIHCVNEPDDGTAIWSADSGGPNNSVKGPLRVFTLAQNHILTCTWHILRQNVK